MVNINNNNNNNWNNRNSNNNSNQNNNNNNNNWNSNQNNNNNNCNCSNPGEENPDTQNVINTLKAENELYKQSRAALCNELNDLRESLADIDPSLGGQHECMTENLLE